MSRISNRWRRVLNTRISYTLHKADAVRCSASLIHHRRVFWWRVWDKLSLETRFVFPKPRRTYWRRVLDRNVWKFVLETRSNICVFFDRFLHSAFWYEVKETADRQKLGHLYVSDQVGTDIVILPADCPDGRIRHYERLHLCIPRVPLLRLQAPVSIRPYPSINSKQKQLGWGRATTVQKDLTTKYPFISLNFAFILANLVP